VKIDKNAMTIVVENVYENATFESVAEDLEESAPRFVIVSYRYILNDGRKQFPIIFYVRYMCASKQPIVYLTLCAFCLFVLLCIVLLT